MSLGPNRQAAVEEQKPGRCAMCDGRIPKHPRGNRGRYTCGSHVCTRAWADLCKMDQRAALKQVAA
jgi:hypothetical protein